MAKIITKKFTSGFTHWVDTLPAGVRMIFQHPITGKPYWISREKFLENYSSGGVSGGATAYEIYAATTSDRPVLSEVDWIASLHGSDGEIPYIGTNGNWWVGTTDTGIRAQSTTVTPTIFISGIKKGMTIEWFDPDNIPTGFVLSDGNYKNNFVPINGIVIPDHRDVMPMGYNPAKPDAPTDVSDDTENYGKVGNTGGANSIKLNIDQLPEHSFFTVSKIGRGNADTLMHSPTDSVIATEATGDVQDDNNNAYKLYAAPAGSVPNSGKTNTIGKGATIPIRPKYGVFCYITKVSDDDQNLEVGGQFIDPIPGTNILINKNDLAHPVFSVDMTKVESIANSDAKLLNKVDKNGTDRLITEAEIAEFRGKQNNLGFTPEQAGVAEQLIDALKDGVTSDGDTLKKLYDLIVSRYSEITVANIADRDAYNITKLPTSVFVQDDGDTRWALYKAITTGTNASYIKLSDPDLLNSVMSASQIAAAYESVPDVNRFTNAYKLELETAYGWGNHADAGYLKTESAFNSWNKSDGISISKSQIRDFPDSLKSTYALTINGAAGYSKIYDGSLPISITYSDVNAAPASTVGFPGFGTAHYLAAYGDHGHAGVYEPVITSGYTNQYWRGDKTWQLMPTSFPASDVYAWAKAASKPSYSWSEIGSKPTTVAGYGITDMGSQSVNYANSAGSASRAGYLTLSNIGSPDQTGINGIYYCQGGSTPAPSGSADGTLIASSYVNAPDTWGSQIYQDYRAGYLYIRGRNNGSWSSWLRVIDSNTIGSQSVYSAGRLQGADAFTTGTDGWWRSNGNCGWYSSSYGVGIYAIDSTYVRTYNSASFVANNIIANGYLSSGGDIYMNQNYGRTLVGVYDASRLQGIFTMGDSWRLAADGTSSGNLYGLAWSHPNAGGQAANLSTHGMLVMENGTTNAAISSNIWIRGTYYGSGAGLTGVSFTGHTHDYATHRGEGTNFVDYSRYVYNNGAYSGSGWVEPSDLGVRYASSSNYATSAGNASTVGGYTAAQLLASGGNWDTSHNFNFSGAGYQKFSNGLMIQWGSGTANTTTLFSWSFPNTCLNVQVTMNTNDTIQEALHVFSLNSSSFYCRQFNQSKTFFYLAIGY